MYLHNANRKLTKKQIKATIRFIRFIIYIINKNLMDLEKNKFKINYE